MNPAPPRFNPWPYGIIAVFAIFVPATVGLVVLASANRMDLVAGDYYEQEVRYQGRLESLNRTHALGSRAGIKLESARQQLIITIPSEHEGRLTDGQIVLYRPSAAGMDRRMKLAVNSDGRQTVDVNTLPAGRWKVRVQWKVAAEEFLLEETVNL